MPGGRRPIVQTWHASIAPVFGMAGYRGARPAPEERVFFARLRRRWQARRGRVPHAAQVIRAFYRRRRGGGGGMCILLRTCYEI